MAVRLMRIKIQLREDCVKWVLPTRGAALAEVDGGLGHTWGSSPAGALLPLPASSTQPPCCPSLPPALSRIAHLSSGDSVRALLDGGLAILVANSASVPAAVDALRAAGQLPKTDDVRGRGAAAGCAGWAGSRAGGPLGPRFAAGCARRC